MGKGIASLLALSARTETKGLLSAVANTLAFRSRPVGIYNALIGGPSLRQPCLLPEEPFFLRLLLPWGRVGDVTALTDGDIDCGVVTRGTAAASCGRTGLRFALTAPLDDGDEQSGGSIACAAVDPRIGARSSSWGFGMPMRPEDIPRRQERLILADATQQFERLLVTRVFTTHDIASFAELAHIARSNSHGSTNRTQNRDAAHNRAAQAAVHVEARLRHSGR
jgi:hypothetical protein